MGLVERREAIKPPTTAKIIQLVANSVVTAAPPRPVVPRVYPVGSSPRIPHNSNPAVVSAIEIAASDQAVSVAERLLICVGADDVIDWDYRST
jgi:hypothetical protein